MREYGSITVGMLEYAIYETVVIGEVSTSLFYFGWLSAAQKRPLIRRNPAGNHQGKGAGLLFFVKIIGQFETKLMKKLVLVAIGEVGSNLFLSKI